MFFIVSNEFCERFSYYGMRGNVLSVITAILSTVYTGKFLRELYFTEDESENLSSS